MATETFSTRLDIDLTALKDVSLDEYDRRAQNEIDAALSDLRQEMTEWVVNVMPG